MNRKQRRATLKHGPPDARAAEPAGSQINRCFWMRWRSKALASLTMQRAATNASSELNPDHTEAHNNLARVFHAQGKAKDASVFYAHALALMPQLFQQYSGIRGTLTSLLPQLDQALRRQMAAWPKRLARERTVRRGRTCRNRGQPAAARSSAIDADSRCRIRRLLTALRASLASAATAGKPVADLILGFACALARQCFINEYVFATTPDEDVQLEDLGARAPALRRARCKSPRSRCTRRCTRCPAHQCCSNGNGIRLSTRC